MRFGIRSLLTLILIAACGLGCWTWHHRRVERREAAIKAVAAAPDPLGWDFNPVSLIRAINQLHSLGQRDALMALEQFDKTYPNEGYSCPHQSLELVMPLLFDRRNPEEKYPRPKNWFDQSEGIVLDQESWDYWIIVEDGIPFHTVMIGGTSGMPGNHSYLIGWARDYATTRVTNDSWRPFSSGGESNDKTRRGGGRRRIFGLDKSAYSDASLPCGRTLA